MALDYSSIGRRIARRRKELHMTQAQVAELLRPMDGRQLSLAKSFLTWLSEQKI